MAPRASICHGLSRSLRQAFKGAEAGNTGIARFFGKLIQGKLEEPGLLVDVLLRCLGVKRVPESSVRSPRTFHPDTQGCQAAVRVGAAVQCLVKCFSSSCRSCVLHPAGANVVWPLLAMLTWQLCRSASKRRTCASPIATRKRSWLLNSCVNNAKGVVGAPLLAAVCNSGFSTAAEQQRVAYNYMASGRH